MCSTMVGGGWRLAAIGGWQLATGGWWQLVVVGCGWWLVIGGWWRLVVVGGWRLVAAGGWGQLVVGSQWRLAVGGSWRLAVGGPLGRSLRAVLSKKKIWFLMDRPGGGNIMWEQVACATPPLTRKKSPLQPTVSWGGGGLSHNRGFGPPMNFQSGGCCPPMQRLPHGSRT